MTNDDDAAPAQRRLTVAAVIGLMIATLPIAAAAAPALEVLGKDFTFPNNIEGLPAKLSDCQ